MQILHPIRIRTRIRTLQMVAIFRISEIIIVFVTRIAVGVGIAQTMLTFEFVLRAACMSARMAVTTI